MALMSFREALNQAIAEEMDRDSRVFILGEEVAQYDGAYKVTQGLLRRFGPERVLDTPISETAFFGLGVGAALAGLRPIVEVMTFNFSFVAFDQIINNAAKLRFMSGGQLQVPMVIRGPHGAAHMLGAQHSHAVAALYAHFPGIKVCVPATPADGKGLLKTAIRDENPVLVLESELLYGMKGEVPEGEHLVPLGKGEVVQSGTDVTIVSVGRMRHVALAAVERLAKQGISAELIDLRSVRPLDEALLFQSVARTHRCVVVEESWPVCGLGAELAFRLQHEIFDELDAPVARVTSLDMPMPYADNLERLVQPDAERVIAAVRQVLYL